MGWSHKGNTRQKYQHYYNDDAFDAVLTMMDGLTPPSTITNSAKKGLLKPKQCPNCNETNTPESKFCGKCGFTWAIDAINETIQSAEKTKKDLEEIKIKQQAFETILRKMVASDLDVDINDPEEQNQIANVMKKVLAGKWNLFDTQ